MSPELEWQTRRNRINKRLKAQSNQYDPDYVSPPGETLQETLLTLGMSQASLADRTGRSLKMINEIIKGKAPITPKLALELERVVGVPATLWNNREKIYRESVARVEEQKRLESFQNNVSIPTTC
jgi:addiction module HigA family antidote